MTSYRVSTEIREVVYSIKPTHTLDWSGVGYAAPKYVLVNKKYQIKK